jgi:hypothetical protein
MKKIFLLTVLFTALFCTNSYAQTTSTTSNACLGATKVYDVDTTISPTGNPDLTYAWTVTGPGYNRNTSC